jgi:predicted secreted hydrolase
MLPVLLLALPLYAAEPRWRAAEPGYHYQFPRDHFEHPDFRTEWWYYTGNVRAQDGHRYGFELVFFRQGQRRGPSENQSAWRADDVYLAHLALTDVDGKWFRSARRLNRAGPGVAGASFAERRIWNGNWEARWEPDGSQTLTALSGDIRFRLQLSPVKPPVIHGENGVSRKAGGAGKASHYVSFTRLAVEGTLGGGAVSGSAWMDHEWFTHQLEPDQVGWDWFSVQLDNRTELMLFQLRRKDGDADAWSSGTFVDAGGTARHLRREDFSLEPVEWWTSAKSGGRYPVKWKVRVPVLGVSLECAALVPGQELAEKESVGPVYWEGAVVYSGSASGVGYLEMTGYAAPVRLE